MKVFLKRVGAAVVAAVTSPEVVKAARSTAVLVIVRLTLALGASASVVALVKAVVEAVLGG